MGYYTDYTIEIQSEKMYDAGLMDSIKQALITISGYTGWSYAHDQITLIEAKWYDNFNDMQKLSEQFPDVKFEMLCQGEDGQQWMIYAFNGKAEQCDGEIVFPPRTLW